MANLMFGLELADRTREAGSEKKSFIAHPGIARTVDGAFAQQCTGRSCRSSCGRSVSPRRRRGPPCWRRSPRRAVGYLFGPKFRCGSRSKAGHAGRANREAGREGPWEESEKLTGKWIWTSQDDRQVPQRHGRPGRGPCRLTNLRCPR